MISLDCEKQYASKLSIVRYGSILNLWQRTQRPQQLSAADLRLMNIDKPEKLEEAAMIAELMWF